MDLLEEEGFKVLQAENGQAGLQLVHQHKPDLILCDVMMPVMDGFAVLKALRENKSTAAIPLIFLTARSERTDLRTGMNLGADDYLTKPVTREELLTALSTRFERLHTVTQHVSSELQAIEKRYNYLVHYDNNTRLPNHSLLTQRLQQAITNSRKDGYEAGLLFLELARFDSINYSLGYTIGNQLLKLVAARLQTLVPGSDMVAHIQADRFAILVNQITDPLQLEQLAQKVIDTLSQPFTVYGHELVVVPSVGIALSSSANSAETMLQHAGSALTYLRKVDSQQFSSYQPEMDVRSQDQLLLEAALHQAIVKQEFELYYQPQIELASGRLVGAEALVRWHNSERGTISPLDFIPLAEEAGLVAPIGQWVLETACQQVRDWQKKNLGNLRIAVNLSSLQFNQGNLGEQIMQILSETGLEPQYLELELTESVIAQNIEAIGQTLQQLQQKRIQISIDDFGTGYSSLSYLKNLPCNILKIDRSFVMNINNDTEYAAITVAIIQMAHNLNLKVIAEGVETEGEHRFLLEQGCDIAQGYLYSKPLPASEFEKLLAEQKKWLLS